MATRVAVMNAGRLVQIGTPAELYERPNSRFVAAFVGEVNLFEGGVTRSSGGAVLCIAGLDEPMPVCDCDAKIGRMVVAAVRPEKLLLSRERPPGPALRALVVGSDYQGPVSILRLTWGEQSDLKAHLPSSIAAGFARGSWLWVSWRREDTIVIRQ